MKSLLSALVATVLLTACGSGGTGTTTTTTSNAGNNPPPPANCTEQQGNGSLKILGSITYERINPLHNDSSTTLDSNNITIESAKDILVAALDSAGNILASGCTNTNGDYTLEGIPTSTSLKIRAYAKMKNSIWDVKVVDNTNSDVLYAIEGNLHDSGTSNSSRDLKASYSNDTAAPFAILDSVHQAMDKIRITDSNVIFPVLKLNWSINNKSTLDFQPTIGHIPTTFYGDNNIYVLGDKATDTDEFDNHIIIHEWGHYFEDVFSRSDSIGYSHGPGQKLDIRVAFGEGFGNAFSAIATDDPIYYDTFKNGTQGNNMNIESGTQNTPGYYSEASIQRILYDFYDNHNDGADNLSMGFKPLYNTLIGSEKTTPAFTSIFTFITALKNENSAESAKIDAITSAENISDISDIYGTSNDVTLYQTLLIGSSINISTNTNNGAPNKLNNHRYIRFTVNSAKSYRIRVDTTSSNSPDPDFALYTTSPFNKLSQGLNTGTSEIKDIYLKTGDYLIDIYDANFLSSANFTVMIN